MADMVLWNRIRGLWAFHPKHVDDPLSIFRTVFAGFMVGMAAGLVVAFFRVTSSWAYGLLVLWAAQTDKPLWLIGVFAGVALLAALFTGWLMLDKAIRFGGSGWEMKALKDGQEKPFEKILLPKFLGSWLVMAFGISVGREGPSIQMGAASAMCLQNPETTNALQRRYFILGGCAAGLAAAFSAPFSGICYVYEVMQEKIDRLMLTFLLGGSFGGYVSVTQIFGLGVMLPFDNTPIPGIALFPLLLPLGLLAGLTGIAYNKLLHISMDWYGRLKFFPAWLHPIFPFFGAGIMLLFFPAITGEGLSIFASIQQGQALAGYLCLFLVAKLLFTAFCYGSGIPAGVMVPLLCVGGVTGGIFGDCMQALGWIDPQIVSSFIVMGMAGAFAAAERAPITGLMLTLEMTATWTTAPGMLLVVAIAAYCGHLAKLQKI